MDVKINGMESRISRLESDDVSTAFFRSVNESVISEDGSEEETLNLLAEGFILPERNGKYKYDKGVWHSYWCNRSRRR